MASYKNVPPRFKAQRLLVCKVLLASFFPVPMPCNQTKLNTNSYVIWNVIARKYRRIHKRHIAKRAKKTKLIAKIAVSTMPVNKTH